MRKIWARVVSFFIRFFNWWINTYKKQNTKGKWRFGCLTFLIVGMLCDLPFYLYSNQIKSIAATSAPLVIINTPIVTKPAVLTPTLFETSTPIPTTEVMTPILKGLTNGDLKVKLEQKGFSCSRPDKGDLYYVRTCELKEPSYQIRVDIYGRELLSIDYVESGVIQYGNPSKELASAFFQYIAKLLFETAQPQEAAEWIKTNLSTHKGKGDLREKIIGNIKFSLSGIPTAYILGIGDLQQ